MIRYVAGFLMDATSIFLVRKIKPPHLNGKLNGIGGKVEPNETLLQAMEREFKEEVGVQLSGWREFCTLKGNYALDDIDIPQQFEITFFSRWVTNSEKAKVRPGFNDSKEPMSWYPVHLVLLSPEYYGLMPNCLWLIPMARIINDRAQNYQIIEVY